MEYLRVELAERGRKIDAVNGQRQSLGEATPRIGRK
jgi:hypothetical protein